MKKISLFVLSLLCTQSFSQQVLKRITQTSTELTVELFTFRNGSTNCSTVGNINFWVGSSERPHYLIMNSLYNYQNGNELTQLMNYSENLYNQTTIENQLLGNGNFVFTLDLARKWNGQYFIDYSTTPTTYNLIYPINIIEISAIADSFEDSNVGSDLLYAKFIVPKVLSDGNPIPIDLWLKCQSWKGYDNNGITTSAEQLWFKFNGTDWILQNQRFYGTTYTIPDDICNNLGISEFEQSNIKCYPNPTKDIVNLSTPNETINQINVYDMFGRLLKSQKGYNNSEQIDIQELPKAMYLLEIITEKGKQSVKVVKK